MWPFCRLWTRGGGQWRPQSVPETDDAGGRRRSSGNRPARGPERRSGAARQTSGRPTPVRGADRGGGGGSLRGTLGMPQGRAGDSEAVMKHVLLSEPVDVIGRPYKKPRSRRCTQEH